MFSFGNVCAIMKIMLRLLGCVLFWPLDEVPSRELGLETWFLWLLPCSSLPELVQLAVSQVLFTFLPGLRLCGPAELRQW